MADLGRCHRCVLYGDVRAVAIVAGTPVCEMCAGCPPGDLPAMRSTYAAEELVRILSQRAYREPCRRCGCSLVPEGAERCPVCAKSCV